MPRWTSGGFQAIFEIPYFLDALSDLMFVHAMLHSEFLSEKWHNEYVIFNLLN